MYYPLGTCLALAALLTINALSSLVMAALWRAIRQRARRWSAQTRARIIFALRIFPPAIALVYIAALLLPAYAAFEPRSSAEVVSTKIAALALISALGIVSAIWRGLTTWLETRRLVADWLNHSEVVSLPGVSIPVYRVEHPFPVIAVVGAIRPRMFIASQIFDTLNDKELAAAIIHEEGHLAALDNLKRALMCGCRAVLSIVPCGRSLDRAWSDEAEAAADEYAAQAGATVALDLAAALIKIARMAPKGAKPTMPAGAFLIDESGSSIVGRIRRLTQLAEMQDRHKWRGSPLANRVVAVSLCVLFAMVVLTATNYHVLTAMHAAIERIVWVLQ